MFSLTLLKASSSCLGQETPSGIAAIDDEAEAPALPEDHWQDPLAPGRHDDTDAEGRQHQLA